MNKSASHRLSFALSGVSSVDAIKHFDGKAMGQLQVFLPVTPCLKADGNKPNVGRTTCGIRNVHCERKICSCFFGDMGNAIIIALVTDSTAVQIYCSVS